MFTAKDAHDLQQSNIDKFIEDSDNKIESILESIKNTCEQSVSQHYIYVTFDNNLEKDYCEKKLKILNYMVLPRHHRLHRRHDELKCVVIWNDVKLPTEKISWWKRLFIRQKDG